MPPSAGSLPRHLQACAKQAPKPIGRLSLAVFALASGIIAAAAAVPEWRLDASFQSALAPGSSVVALTPAPDGAMLVAGQLTLLGRSGGVNLVRLLSDGSADPTFPALVAGGIGAVQIDGNGSIFVCGSSQPTFVKLKPDGVRDLTFKAGSSGTGTGFDPDRIPLTDPRWILPRTDGSVTIGGSTLLRYHNQVGLLWLKPNGTVDEAFIKGTGVAYGYPGNNNAVVSVDGGRFVIGGGFAQVHGTPIQNLARINPDGSLDTSFNPGKAIWAPVKGSDRSGLVKALAVEPDGDLLVAAHFYQDGFIQSVNVLRVRPDGSLDAKFASTGTTDGDINALGTLSDGRIIVAGSFSTFSGVPCDSVVCLDPDGTVNSVFPPGQAGTRILGDQVTSISVMSDDRVYLGVGAPSSGLHRIRLDAPASKPPVLTHQPVGQSLLEGRELVLHVEAEGVPLPTIRWKRDGVEIPGQEGRELRILRVSTALAGDYTAVLRNVEGTIESQPARVTVSPSEARNGAVDLSFDPPLSPGGAVLDLLDLGPEGVLVAREDAVAGQVGVTRHRDTGAIDPSFRLVLRFPQLQHQVRLVRDGTDRLLVAGNFTEANAANVPPIIRVDAAGQRDMSFVATLHAGSAVNDVLVLPSGDRVIAGVFTNVGGLPRQGVARLRSDGAIDPSFDPGTSLAKIQLLPALGFNAVRSTSTGGFILSGWHTAAQLDGHGVATPVSYLDFGATGPHGIQINTDGTLLLAIGTGTVGTGADLFSGLVPLAPDGSIAASPRIKGSGANITALAALPDGRLLAGGATTRSDGTAGPGMVRFDASGVLDTSFDIGNGIASSLNGLIQLIEPASAGGVWVGGDFDRFDGVVVPGVVRLHGPIPVPALNVGRKGNQVTVQTAPKPGRRYRLAYRDSLDSGAWTLLPASTGQAGPLTLTDPAATGIQRYYRVVQD